MRNVLKLKIEVKFHIISRLGVVGVQKGRFEHPKIKFSSKMTKFAGKIEIIIIIIIMVLFYLSSRFYAVSKEISIR